MKKNEFLLTKSVLQIEGNQDLKSDFTEIIRQKPNHHLLGLPVYLWVYNRFDSTSVVQNKHKYMAKLRAKNLKLLAKQQLINDKRIEKALKRGQNDYKYKNITLKDTLNPKLSIKEWMKFRIGEAPVIFDSIYFNKSIEQLGIYLKKKGYYDAKIAGVVSYNLKKQKVKNTYVINTGASYLIDTLLVSCENLVVERIYKKYLNSQINQLKKGDNFDSDRLNQYREYVSRFIQSNGIYGFNSSDISFLADTNRIKHNVKITILFSDKYKKINPNSDELTRIPYALSRISNVYFHLVDTTYFKRNFKEYVEKKGMTLITNGFVRNLDTLNYVNSEGVRHDMKKYNISEDKRDSIVQTRSTIVTYNERISVNADLLEMQILQGKNTYYNITTFEKSVNNLVELGLFQTVKPEIIERNNEIEIHYYLVPKKQMMFSFSPRVTTSGVFLGVSGSANFTNTNLFRGSEKMVLSFSGGFQSMPNLSYQNASSSSNVADNVKQVFNTFEIGPSSKFDLPGLFPFSINSLQKTQKARTILITSFGYQKRSVFTKQSFKLNYIYNFIVGKNTELQFGFPGFSSINFVNFLQFDETFKTNIYKNKDPFTQNYYRSQLNWQDFKFVFQYRNNDKTSNDRSTKYFKTTFDIAGNFLSLFSKYEKTTTELQRTIFGITYSQFVRLDNEFVYAYQLTKNKSFHFRTLIGGGLPYGNSKFSLPFDYSFFGGGPNDIRAWRAGTLGPGSYSYYLDKNYTTLQLGDVRIGASSEFRFKLSSLMRGAIFIDAGNVWTAKKDENRIGSQITNTWFKEIAVATGLGLRADFDYFVVRLDYGFKLRNPAMKDGSRWFFQPKDKQVYDIINNNTTYTSPFFPRNWTDFINSFRVGIGYPF